MGMRNFAGALALAATLVAAPAVAGHHEQTAGEEMETKHATPAQPPASGGSVVRAQFALAVIDREPTDAVSRVSNDQNRVFFFTELHRFQGQELIHRWEFAGEVKVEVAIGVGGPRWRAYSSKALDPSWLGTWTVSVVDAAGNVVARESFDYVETPAPVATEATPAATNPGPAALSK